MWSHVSRRLQFFEQDSRWCHPIVPPLPSPPARSVTVPLLFPPLQVIFRSAAHLYLLPHLEVASSGPELGRPRPTPGAIWRTFSETIKSSLRQGASQDQRTHRDGSLCGDMDSPGRAGIRPGLFPPGARFFIRGLEDEPRRPRTVDLGLHLSFPNGSQGIHCHHRGKGVHKKDR